MPKYQETAEDLAKKYHGTYILYDGEVVSIAHFQGAGKEILANVGRENQKPQITTIDPTKIDVLTFDSMFVNNAKSDDEKNVVPATLFTRNPRRQWKRGMSDENCRLSCPLNSLYKSYGKRLYGWDNRISYRLIAKLQKPVYPLLAEARYTIDKFQALALSPMFALTLSTLSQSRYLLASTFGFIGEVQGDTIFVHHKPALQEVRDYIFRTRQPVHVEVVNA